MLTRFEKLKIAGSNIGGNPHVTLPGASGATAPRVKVRVTCALFYFDGSPVTVGQMLDCSATDAETLVLRRYAEYIR